MWHRIRCFCKQIEASFLNTVLSSGWHMVYGFCVPLPSPAGKQHSFIRRMQVPSWTQEREVSISGLKKYGVSHDDNQSSGRQGSCTELLNLSADWPIQNPQVWQSGQSRFRGRWFARKKRRAPLVQAIGGCRVPDLQQRGDWSVL